MSLLRQRHSSRNALSQRPHPLLIDNHKPLLHATHVHSQHSYDNIVLLVLTLAACFTRFYKLATPASVIFDEFHFFRFLRHHLQRQFVFDIHPWLGKLTHYFVAVLFRLQPQPDFDIRVTNAYPNSDYIVNRAVSAFFGVLCVPLMYLISRELRLSKAVSFLAACMPLFDNLLLMESRFILLDSQLIAYTNLTLLCALRLWRLARSEYGTARYYRALVATAVSTALAMSVKWTAAVTPFLIAFVCALGIVFLERPLPVLDSLFAALVSLVVYTIPWFIHLKVSVNSTPTAEYMSDAFRHTLHGNASFPYRSDHNVTFLSSLYELHWRQLRANRRVRTRHPWESRWYEWPINARGMFFFIDQVSDSSQQQQLARVLYLIQNPAGALWISTAVLTSIVLLLLLQRYRTLLSPKHHVFRAATVARFMLAGYIFNLVPYMFVERCYFIYHYLPALTYGQLLLAVMVEALPRTVRFIAIALILTTTLVAFIYWSPWVYATPISFASHTKLQWMPRWN